VKIETLVVTAFRGLRDDILPFSGKSLLLYGENGTGKSSVVDALEYLTAGAVSHLEDSQATSTRKHAPHVALPATSLSVAATVRGHMQPARRGADGVLGGPPAIRDFMIALGRSSFILRRAQLLKFITAQDAPRYQQLSALIGADVLDPVEQKWKEAADAAEEERDSRSGACAHLRLQLESVLGPLQELTATAILAQTNIRLKALKEEPLASLEEAESRRVATIAGSSHRASAERAALLNSRVTAMQGLAAVSASLATRESFWNDTTALQAEVAALVQSRMLAVWKSARDLLVAHVVDDCPVCERPIESGELVRSLTARISATEKIAARVAELTASKSRLSADLERARTVANAPSQQLKIDSEAEAAVFAEFSEWCDAWKARLDAPVQELELGTFAAFAIDSPLGSVRQTLEGVSARAQEEIATLIATAADERIVAVADLLGRVVTAALTLVATAEELAKDTASAVALRKIHTLLVSARKRRVQEVYDTLETDITAFYHSIHPSEPYGAVKLTVSATRRGSAAIRTSFAEVDDVDPRAYNSEAHLDSLGLCIFLAFVKHFGAGVPLLVLDDVISSVDAAHRTRICALLLREFTDYQLLVTTHDALWFEEFISIARAMRYTSLTPIRITSWSLEDGPRWSPYVDRWVDMRAKAAADDKQGAASLARHTLEGFLFKLAVNLQAPLVPRADAKYDVGALFEPVMSRAKKLNPRFEDENRSAIVNFRSTALLANLLTHNNLIAAGTSRQEVVDFVESVAELHALFHCAACGQLIRYIRDAKVVQCECGPTGKRWEVP